MSKGNEHGAIVGAAMGLPVGRRTLMTGAACAMGAGLIPTAAGAQVPATLDAAAASQFARMALSHVTREYPMETGMTRSSAAETVEQKPVRPVFYGSFGWGSAVATHWQLARLRNLFPRMPEAASIAAHFDSAFSAEKIAKEMAFFKTPMNEGSGRFGGWAWVMMLSVELGRDKSARAQRWAKLLAPMTVDLTERTIDFLPKLRFPGRGGGTPLGLLQMVDYARQPGQGKLLDLITSNARNWYGEDVVEDRPQLGGEDSIPAEFATAELMRRLLPAAEFDAWFRRYLPKLVTGDPAVLLTPVDAGDRGDPRLTLATDSLNLTRGWLLRNLAKACKGDRRAEVMTAAAARHLAVSLPHVGENYLSMRSLPAYALLALEAGRS
ncbi:DUF2891 family protein [Sphingobium aquiterrae]|uniref:DUF2891 family protein n=1 Tax=Sphingobium aquiterrae TaxID=2038656 RepID=UPI00301AAE1F